MEFWKNDEILKKFIRKKGKIRENVFISSRGRQPEGKKCCSFHNWPVVWKHGSTFKCRFSLLNPLVVQCFHHYILYPNFQRWEPRPIATQWENRVHKNCAKRNIFLTILKKYNPRGQYEDPPKNQIKKQQSPHLNLRQKMNRKKKSKFDDVESIVTVEFALPWRWHRKVAKDACLINRGCYRRFLQCLSHT